MQSIFTGKEDIMGKKFTKKKLKLRAKAQRRRFSLKTRPKTYGVKTTPEKLNDPVIKSLEKKVKAVLEKEQPQA